MPTTAHRADFRVCIEDDSNPDLSHLGEYSNTPGDGAIETELGPRHYAYFNPANVEYGQQDYECMQAFENGDAYMAHVYAEVELRIPNGEGCFILHTVRTPGVWGVDCDFGEHDEDAAKRDFGPDELAQLEAMLAELGVRVED